MSLWVHVLEDVCCFSGTTVHATRAFGAPSNRKTVTTYCGNQRARLFLVGVRVNEIQTDDVSTLAWPPRVAEANEWGYERCRDCFEATGRPRVRDYEFAKVGA